MTIILYMVEQYSNHAQIGIRKHMAIIAHVVERYYNHAQSPTRNATIMVKSHDITRNEYLFMW